jgi:sigma-54 dependent transcriptional regulator, acetoin dehydrogenase operon transcriptional activator AcoR
VPPNQRWRLGEASLGPAATRALLLAHRWPGNVRELENAVERALIVSEGELLTAAHFGLSASSGGPGDGAAGVPPSPAAARGRPADVERYTILAALGRAKGNKARAAAALGISRTKLYTRLRQLGIFG